MLKRILGLTLAVLTALTASLIYPKAFADSPSNNATGATIYGGKTVTIGNLPIGHNSLPSSQNNASVTAFASSASTDEAWREMRGTWIATVKNINMPSGMDKAAFSKWAAECMELLKANKLNTAVFQVRPTGDALYKSSFAPWSSFITGKAQGTDPGYDPLAIMINEAHARGIELHAWINPYRLTMPSDKLEALSSSNIAAKNPSWVVNYSGQFYLNPGVPEVRAHLVSIVAELVDNYDIDAIHIDDYFYPYPVSGAVYNDDAQYLSFGKAYSDKGDWRRDNVTSLVRDLYTTVKSRKSYVQLGISPFGVWRNKTNDPTGSDTNAGHECYSSLYADTRRWINEGIIDYITPQIYWSRELKQAPYEALLNWWNNEISTQAVNKPVNLYIGQANYKVNNNSDLKWLDPNEISAQIGLNRQAPYVSGQMHYSFASVKENQLNHFGLIKDNYYKYAALTPVQAINEPLQALPIVSTSATRSTNSISLNISVSDVNTRKLLIYRFEGTSAGDFTNANLLGVVYKTGGSTIYYDSTAVSGRTYTYAVKPVSVHGIINQNYKAVYVN